MSRLSFRNLAAVSLIAAMSASAGPSEAKPSGAADVVRIGGTGAGATIMQMIGKDYERTHPGRSVLIAQGLGSTGGIQAVVKGALDIGVTSRPPRKKEDVPDIVSTEFASTPVVLAVGRSSGVTGLTMDEVARIYRGEMTRWPNGEQIRVVLRPRTYNESAIVHSLSPELSSAIDFAFQRPGMIMAMSEQENIDILLHTPGAVGFTSLVQVRAVIERAGAVPASPGGEHAP
jgi:phosphate transport system substrate-binding protein